MHSGALAERSTHGGACPSAGRQAGGAGADACRWLAAWELTGDAGLAPRSPRASRRRQSAPAISGRCTAPVGVSSPPRRIGVKGLCFAPGLGATNGEPLLFRASLRTGEPSLSRRPASRAEHRGPPWTKAKATRAAPLATGAKLKGPSGDPSREPRRRRLPRLAYSRRRTSDPCGDTAGRRGRASRLAPPPTRIPEQWISPGDLWTGGERGKSFPETPVK